jgi:hypothetical protein
VQVLIAGPANSGALPTQLLQVHSQTILLLLLPQASGNMITTSTDASIKAFTALNASQRSTTPD